MDSPANAIDWAFNVSADTGTFFINGPGLNDVLQLVGNPVNLTYSITLDGRDGIVLVGDVEVRDGELTVGDLTVSSINTGLCADVSGASLIGRCTSSIRFKEGVEDLDRGLATVLELRPVTFRWKTEHEPGSDDLGFVAEEVAELDSLLATYDEEGAVQGVKYRRMTALLTKGIQELSQTVEQQQQEIEELKTPVAELAARPDARQDNH